MCSNQNPDKRAADLPIRDLSAIWQLLSIINERSGAGLKLAQFAESDEGTLPLAAQAVARMAAYYRLREGSDLEGAIPTFIRFLEAAELRTTEPADEHLWERTSVPPLAADYWTKPVHQEILLSFVIALAVVATADDPSRSMPTKSWAKDLEHAGVMTSETQAVVRELEGTGEMDASASLFVQAAAAVPLLRRGECTLAQRFNAHARLANALYAGGQRDFAGDAMAKLTCSWAKVAAEQRFALVSPNLYAPEITSACGDETVSGLRKVATILLAVAPAVQVRLNADMRGWLARLSSGI